jgi:hypothetical protein
MLVFFVGYRITISGKIFRHKVGAGIVRSGFQKLDDVSQVLMMY